VSLATTNPYIAIEGVIGVGKTTLARRLKPEFQAGLMLEAFDKNPFLSDFYSDRARYAFQTQIFFLLNRYRQQQSIPSKLREGALLADYFFRKDLLFAELNLAGDEMAMYERLYRTLAENIRPPDLVVYLRAEVETLMARIAMRDRTYEREMDRSYIAALRQTYEQLFATYEATPLLVIESDDLDFVRNPNDLDEIENQIEAALQGIRQPTLPSMEATAPAPITWRLPSVPADEPGTEANWRVLGNFLALTRTVGEVGGALSQHPPIGPDGASEELQRSLLAASKALEALADRIGVELT
jgi:deoxyadenosine/deoxycytidine kinase